MTDTYYEKPELWEAAPEPYQIEVREDLGALLPADTETVLDAGCGNGFALGSLPERVRAFGLDGSAQALAHVGVPSIQADIRTIPLRDGAVDAVMANDVLEHIPADDYRPSIAELFRVARRYVVITVPFVEDLNAGRIHCAGCGAVYHRNQHLRSYAPDDLGALAPPGWHLARVVLSGTVWDDVPEVSWILRAAGVSAAHPHARCPSCGHDAPRSVDVPDPADFDALRAQFASLDVAAGHHAACRTEAICCFHREGSQDPWADSARMASADLELLPTTLDFRSPDVKILQRADLISVGTAPYWCADGGVERSAAGLELERDHEVKIGFFSADDGELRVEGHATSARLQIQYFGDEGYRVAATLDLDGAFRRAIPSPPIGRFGRLCALRTLAGSVHLGSCGLAVDMPAQAFVVAADSPDFLDLGDGVTALSTRMYDTHVPCAAAVNGSIRSRVAALARTAAPATKPGAGHHYRSLAQFVRARNADALRSMTVLAQAADAQREALDLRYQTRTQQYEFARRAHAENQRLEKKVAGLSARLRDHQQRLEEAQRRLTRLARLERLADLTDTWIDKVRGIFRRRTEVDPATWEERTAVMLVPDDRIDRRVLLEARSLIQAGWTVRVVGAPPPFPEYTHDEEQFPEVEIRRVDASAPCPIAPQHASPAHPPGEDDWSDFYWLTNHYYSLAIERPFQVVVAHDLPVLPAAIMAAARHGAFLVYDAHELYPEQHHFGEDRIERYRKAETALAPLPDRIITVNRSIADEMVKRYGVEQPEVILNCPAGVDRAEFPQPGDEFRSAFNLAADRRILLYQGALSLNRNLEALVEAMRHVRTEDVVLVMMGPGDEKRDELRGLAERDGTADQRVFFHPSVPQEDVLRFSRAADAGIIPYPHVDLNSFYCTPNKLFDFLCVGLPILANDSPELRRFVAGQNVGIVHEFTSPESIAAGIDRFFALDHGEFRERLAELGDRYRWDEEGAKVVEIFETLVAKNAPAARWRG